MKDVNSLNWLTNPKFSLTDWEISIKPLRTAMHKTEMWKQNLPHTKECNSQLCSLFYFTACFTSPFIREGWNILQQNSLYRGYMTLVCLLTLHIAAAKHWNSESYFLMSVTAILVHAKLQPQLIWKFKSHFCGKSYLNKRNLLKYIYYMFL
jgi:hypothetical protein